MIITQQPPFDPAKKEAIRQNVDFPALVQADLGEGKRSGQAIQFCCPFHEDRTPSFTVYSDHFHCYGCGAHGDLFAYVMRRHNLGFRDALDLLSGGRFAKARPVPRPAVQRSDDDPPPQVWQDALEVIATDAHERLIHAPEAASAREWLAARGIGEGEIKAAYLGYQPGPPCFPNATAPYFERVETLAGSLKVFSGILIPWVTVGERITWWGIHIRRPVRGKGKYIWVPDVPGGARGGCFLPDSCIPARGRPLMIAEGEFNAIIAHREVGDLVGVLSVGSAHAQIGFRWFDVLAGAPLIIAAYDVDAGSRAGQKGAANLARLSARVRRLKLPLPKGADSIDINDFVVAGGDLRALVKEVLA